MMFLLSKTEVAFTHTANSGGLKILSTNGYVFVESVRFDTNKIGIAADTDIITLTTGNVDIDADVNVGSSMFTVSKTTGDTTVAGTLDVTDNFAVNSNMFEVSALDGTLAYSNKQI